MKQFCRKHTFAVTCILAVAAGLILVPMWFISSTGWANRLDYILELFTFLFIALPPVACFVCYPFALTLVEIFGFIPNGIRNIQLFDLLVVVLGVIFNRLYFPFIGMRDQVLRHLPFPAALLLLPLLLGVGGYWILTRRTPQKWLPRLLCIAGMVLTATAAWWFYWFSASHFDHFNVFLMLLPFNMTLITLRTAIQTRRISHS